MRITRLHLPRLGLPSRRQVIIGGIVLAVAVAGIIVKDLFFGGEEKEPTAAPPQEVGGKFFVGSPENPDEPAKIIFTPSNGAVVSDVLVVNVADQSLAEVSPVEVKITTQLGELNFALDPSKGFPQGMVIQLNHRPTRLGLTLRYNDGGEAWTVRLGFDGFRVVEEEETPSEDGIGPAIFLISYILLVLGAGAGILLLALNRIHGRWGMRVIVYSITLLCSTAAVDRWSVELVPVVLFLLLGYGLAEGIWTLASRHHGTRARRGPLSFRIEARRGRRGAPVTGEFQLDHGQSLRLGLVGEATHHFDAGLDMIVVERDQDGLFYYNEANDEAEEVDIEFGRAYTVLNVTFSIRRASRRAAPAEEEEIAPEPEEGEGAE